MLPTKRFIEETNTLCEGWTPFGVVEDSDGERPASYDHLSEAVSSIVEFISDIDQEIASGDREPDDGYDPGSFRVRDSQTGDMYFFAYGDYANVILVTGPDNRSVHHEEYTS